MYLEFSELLWKCSDRKCDENLVTKFANQSSTLTVNLIFNPFLQLYKPPLDKSDTECTLP
jgi:hypothetical protein